MKTIIAGGRDYNLKALHYQQLKELLKMIPITEVVSGGAAGVDYLGELWAVRNKIPLRRFPADWAAYGRAAGPERNAQMAAYADVLIAFPGGSGTNNMVRQAEKLGLVIYDLRKEVVNEHNSNRLPRETKGWKEVADCRHGTEPNRSEELAKRHFRPQAQVSAAVQKGLAVLDAVIVVLAVLAFIAATIVIFCPVPNFLM